MIFANLLLNKNYIVPFCRSKCVFIVKFYLLLATQTEAQRKLPSAG